MNIKLQGDYFQVIKLLIIWDNVEQIIKKKKEEKVDYFYVMLFIQNNFGPHKYI